MAAKPAKIAVQCCISMKNYYINNNTSKGNNNKIHANLNQTTFMPTERQNS
jgi:hypothetical protein